MSSIDREYIRRKIEELEDYLAKLKEFQALNRAAYTTDYHHYALAEHFLQLAIESVLDICRALVIGLGLRSPDDAHGLFPLLEQQGILSSDFTKRNAHMPGFRNRLVHAYEAIDHDKTYDYLREHLTDFQEFIKAVSRYVLNDDDKP